MEGKFLLMVKFFMLTSFVCLTKASGKTDLKAKKFMKIHVEEASWVSNEIASLDTQGNLNG